jgi:NAD(P)H-dependent flavin oxidoreductase YrpB (nitropropane dioxygenase family)
MDLLDRLRMDVPVAQAGMGGGLAGAELATAVARAGGLGTLGLMPPDQLRNAVEHVREGAPGRAVAVNLLAPFVRRRHVIACAEARVDVAILAFGGDPGSVRFLRNAGVFVIAMVGTEERAREALGWGADGLIAQGFEAGGHLSGDDPAVTFLPRALELADGRPVLLAGGIASGEDTRRALAAGASGVVAGTRFLLTHESNAHPEYQRRILAADRTFPTMLFGLGWPSAHRVVANAATDRWCHDGGAQKLPPRLINAGSKIAAKFGDLKPEAIVALQRVGLPLFSPVAPTKSMPDSWVDRTALYAGESVLRMTSVVSAREAVDELAGR